MIDELTRPGAHKIPKGKYGSGPLDKLQRLAACVWLHLIWRSMSQLFLTVCLMYV